MGAVRAPIRARPGQRRARPGVRHRAARGPVRLERAGRGAGRHQPVRGRDPQWTPGEALRRHRGQRLRLLPSDPSRGALGHGDRALQVMAHRAFRRERHRWRACRATCGVQRLGEGGAARIMRSTARVVVIGGGVVGASVLYHLTKAGWSDVVLIERDELTCGSTWHAAGGMHTVNGDPNVARLQQYTINLYREIEGISGQSCGVHLTGGLMLAGTRERLDWLKMAQARGRYLGMELEMLTVDEAARRFPLLDKRHFVGAIFDPVEGHVDPYGVTHAYAKSAQIAGAEVVRHTRVVDLKQRSDGTWDVITDHGNVRAEHVVNAGGLWAREVGRMVGLELPILAMEHQYLITEEIAALKGQKEQLHCIDFEGEIYTRQERGGMLLGTYERAGVPWSPATTPWDFTQSLLPNDLDRIAPSLEVGFEHFPALAEVGIRKVVNGPFTFAPDGNPLVGPVRGLQNFWVACGVMAGFSQGGGVGLALAQWMVEGDPGADVWAMDVARYGDWATLAYTNAKVRENYSRRFRIRFPNEELPAGRPFRTSPVYEQLQAEHAVF